MTKSKGMLLVSHGVEKTLVPASYLAILDSQDYDRKVCDVLRMGVSKILGRPITNECCLDGTCVYDADSYPIEPGEFTVNEHFGGYSVTHNESGLNRWISDGVDCLSAEDDEGNDVTLHAGCVGFLAFWNEMMNEDREALEAYFPELVEEA